MAEGWKNMTLQQHTAKTADPHNEDIDLTEFQQPSAGRSIWQLANTLIPYFTLLVAAFWLTHISYWLVVPAVALAALFLIRLFIIFHDCGHGSFFASTKANDIVGTIAGFLTFTPYYYWHKAHAKHHATSANLDKRGYGDVWTMTVEEFQAASRKERIQYRLYRNPAVMFILGPLFILLITNRIVRRKANRRERWSVYYTNIAVVLMAVGMCLIPGVGWRGLLFVQLPILYFGTMLGIWLFYVQHQFEGVYWAREPEWDFEAASLEGGSFYALPTILHWFTGNIGYHHIHHLSSRIPNYYLPKCHKQFERLAAIPPVGIRRSLKSFTYRLWDEAENRLVGFRRARVKQTSN
jgi:acyl-lipid omega-6 desaturase (Delta-12 desaturase)